VRLRKADLENRPGLHAALRPLGDALDDLAERAEAAVAKLKGAALEDEMVIEQAVSRALKKASQQIWDRRPIVETIILRL
jgi:ribonuclease J